MTTPAAPKPKDRKRRCRFCRRLLTDLPVSQSPDPAKPPKIETEHCKHCDWGSECHKKRGGRT